MSAVLHPHWYRVASLHPRLAPGVSVHRQAVSNGRIDHVLRDAASGRAVRINASAYSLVGRMTGRVSFEEIWRRAIVNAGEDAPTQGECIDVLSTLVERGMVRCETTADSVVLVERERGQRRQRFAAALNPLSLRVPLGNPARAVEAIARRLPASPAIAWVSAWAALVMLALWLLGESWDALGRHAAELMQAPRALMLLWVLYPIVKAVHEMAHALVLYRLGGQVREIGFTLMLGVPVPYVDASDADAFPRRRERMAVAAAGIAAELALAALAAMVWLLVAPGWVRDVSLTVMLIGGVSTLLFNGNPLMRLDGYHVMAEGLGMPNLATRANAVWLHWMRRRVVGVREAPLAESFGLQLRLAAYGFVAIAYRCVVAVAVITWASAFSTLLAIVVGALFAFGLVLRPLWKTLQWLAASAQLHGGRSRHAMRAAVGAGAVLLLLAAVPMPRHLSAQGVVWLPPEAEVRAEEDGFVTRVDALDGRPVQRGQALVQMESPPLVAAAEKTHQLLAALDVEFNDALLHQPVRAQSVAAAIEVARAQNERAEQRLAALAVRAGVDGQLALARADNWPGRFVRKGDTLGHVLADDLVVVRAVVGQDDIALLRDRRDLPAGSDRISVRLADDAGRSWPAQIVRETPAATRKLPAPSLGERAGGPVAQDPADRSGNTSLQPWHVVDVRLAGADLQQLGGRIGTRAYVRFDLPPQPLLQRWIRSARQLLLGHFTREA